jgi:hypothetical protein
MVDDTGITGSWRVSSPSEPWPACSEWQNARALPSTSSFEAGAFQVFKAHADGRRYLGAVVANATETDFIQAFYGEMPVTGSAVFYLQGFDPSSPRVQLQIAANHAFLLQMREAETLALSGHIQDEDETDHH